MPEWLTRWLARPALLAVLVAVVQTGALAAMVLDRAWHVASGREIVLPVIPVDPRSLFRGDYVILNYDISRVPAPVADGDRMSRDGEKLYVTLERRTEGAKQTWAVVDTARAHGRPLTGDRIVLAARQVGPPYREPGGKRTLRVRYGIESYFVPEGTGRDLEQRVRAGTLSVVVAVDGQGSAAIKGLVLDGQVRYDEPLF